ncbi:integrase core domain protein [Methyloversatilis sp. RAC08]|mgnify:CR=1 FL=1|nr:integrase core domain protein [Methyloversatilis sp. RAC08]
MAATWRLWNKAGFQVQRAPAANHAWAYDLVFDTCANSQQLKCLTVIDERTREALAIDVAGSIRSERVVEVLSRLISERGAPKFLRSDNGPEFVSTRLLQWAAGEGLQMALSQPGKPWQNGTDESFNGKFRDECLSMEYFRNRTEARVVIEQWRRHYNAVRPHSALGYLTPAQFVYSLSGKDHEATSFK